MNCSIHSCLPVLLPRWVRCSQALGTTQSRRQNRDAATWQERIPHQPSTSASISSRRPATSKPRRTAAFGGATSVAAAPGRPQSAAVATSSRYRPQSAALRPQRPSTSTHRPVSAVSRHGRSRRSHRPVSSARRAVIAGAGGIAAAPASELRSHSKIRRRRSSAASSRPMLLVSDEEHSTDSDIEYLSDHSSLSSFSFEPAPRVAAVSPVLSEPRKAPKEQRTANRPSTFEAKTLPFASATAPFHRFHLPQPKENREVRVVWRLLGAFSPTYQIFHKPLRPARRRTRR